MSKRRSWAVVVLRFIGSAPLTYSWLAVLLVTTIIAHHLDRRQWHAIVVAGSTNIAHLAKDPLEVLIDSLLWIDGRYWTPYLVLFTLFLAPAERWLGQLRWITVGLTAHVGATYISEGLLKLAIDSRDAPEKLMHAADIGVSYFLVGVMGMLTYHIVTPWRWGYLVIVLVIFGFPLTRIDPKDLNFTAIGHFSSILIGLCCYALARDRQGRSIDPARVPRLLRRRGSRDASA
ncbi:rhomboid-like protein [Mycobacterium haemophilum]|uniref:rhomboid-like protein n=1 Tax=Mycobacterium haemophilum TaxID=29311 RepID=UPI001E5207F7|nr:rhomboid-like protein [Mycobacterium haemophilum]